MTARRPLRNPILLAIGMIVILIALSVGWVIMAAQRAMDQANRAPVYWTLLTVGATFFLLIIVGVVMYLTLSIKAINLSRRQSNFIDSVTHELKSPIASLKLYLQTLDKHQPSAKERQEFYQLMLDDVERLDQLINHVLDAARLDRPISERTTEQIALDELLRECSIEVCQRHRVPISTVKLELTPYEVQGTRVDYELIFRNLLDNALKYSGSPPEVEVRLDEDVTGGARVRISDNGRGIPQKLRQKVFGRFVRAGTELEREKPGLGLGLFIVRTLVLRSRGRVKVHGGEQGRGTTFEVTLPRGVAKSTPPSNSSAASVTMML